MRAEAGDEVWIPTGGEAQWNGIDGTEAVDHVCAEEQRDVQAALFHGQMLIGVGARLADGVEHGAEAAGGCELHGVNVIGGYGVDGDDDA